MIPWKLERSRRGSAIATQKSFLQIPPPFSRFVSPWKTPPPPPIIIHRPESTDSPPVLVHGKSIASFHTEHPSPFRPSTAAPTTANTGTLLPPSFLISLRRETPLSCHYKSTSKTPAPSPRWPTTPSLQQAILSLRVPLASKLILHLRAIGRTGSQVGPDPLYGHDARVPDAS